MKDEVDLILDRICREKIPRSVFKMAVLQAIRNHKPCSREKAYNVAWEELLVQNKKRRGYEDDWVFQELMRSGLVDRRRDTLLTTTMYGEYIATVGYWPRADDFWGLWNKELWEREATAIPEAASSGNPNISDRGQ